MIAFNGVRSSWDMCARNCDLCRLTDSSSSYSRRSSSFMRLRFTASEPSSSRLSISMCVVKSPAAISASRASVRRIGSMSDLEMANPSSSASTTLATPTATKRLRDAAYELPFCAMSALVASPVVEASRSVRAPRSLSALMIAVSNGRTRLLSAPAVSSALIRASTDENR